MCTFISLILPVASKDVVNDALKARDARAFRRRVTRVDTSLLRAVMASHEQEFWFVSPACDCCTFLGSALRAGPSQVDQQVTARAKYQRKGWSEAKIARALNAREAAAERVSRHGQPNETAEDWIGLLSDLCRALALPSLGVMHHFYAAAPGREDIDVSRMQGGALIGAASAMAHMADGVVHDFHM